jgi:hypothetical protein
MTVLPATFTNVTLIVPTTALLCWTDLQQVNISDISATWPTFLAIHDCSNYWIAMLYWFAACQHFAFAYNAWIFVNITGHHLPIRTTMTGLIVCWPFQANERLQARLLWQNNHVSVDIGPINYRLGVICLFHSHPQNIMDLQCTNQLLVSIMWSKWRQLIHNYLNYSTTRSIIQSEQSASVSHYGC